MLNVTTKTEKDLTVVSLEGRLDAETAPLLEQELQRVMESAEELAIDCSSLSYISSAGLRVILAAHRRIYRMKLVNVNEAVAEILDITGFADILTIEKTEGTENDR